MRWICLHCSAEYDDRPPACGSCLRLDLIAPLPSRLEGRDVSVMPRQRAGVVAARDLTGEFQPAPYGDPFASAWRIGDPHAVELLGPAGGGKSTLAMRMAVSAARRIDVLYVAAEEGHSAMLRERLQRVGGDDMIGARLRISDARTMAELKDDLAHNDARLVFIDSVTELKATAEQIATALLGRSWVVVSQVNGKGGTYGGPTMAHAVDVVIDVAEGLARVRKNRYGGSGSIRVWGTEEAA